MTLSPNAHRALQFFSHVRLREKNPLEPGHKLTTENRWLETVNYNVAMSTSAANAPARTDWSLIWAAPGFRYFFFAMFISLFGSGMNFAGVGTFWR